jgi:hypothetical protein
MWFFLGFFLGVYVPVTVAGLMPGWVHVGLLMMAWMALGYPNELAALGKRRKAVKAEPLPESEAFSVRVRFEQARREEALSRKHRRAWQRATPHGAKVGVA